MSDRTRNILDFALFQLGWFACVLGGAGDDAWLGPACAAVILTAHVALRPRGRRASELTAIAAITVAGCALDAGNVAAGFLSYHGAGLLGIPAWVVALWALFASMFDSALRWLRTRLVLAATCAAIGSPLSYVAGERLGAVAILEPRTTSLVAVALSWAVFVPLALWARARLGDEPATTARST